MRLIKSEGWKPFGSDLDWSSCPVATTVLYNLAVSANENPNFTLSRRSYTTLIKSIRAIDELIDGKEQTSKYKLQLFSFVSPRLVDHKNTAHEQAVQSDLYDVLKATRDIKNRKRVFTRVYTMAACLPEYLAAKFFSVLYTRWETLNTAATHHRQRVASKDEAATVDDGAATTANSQSTNASHLVAMSSSTVNTAPASASASTDATAIMVAEPRLATSEYDLVVALPERSEVVDSVRVAEPAVPPSPTPSPHLPSAAQPTTNQPPPRMIGKRGTFKLSERPASCECS